MKVGSAEQVLMETLAGEGKFAEAIPHAEAADEILSKRRTRRHK